MSQVRVQGASKLIDSADSWTLKLMLFSNCDPKGVLSHDVMAVGKFYAHLC